MQTHTHTHFLRLPIQNEAEGTVWDAVKSKLCVGTFSYRSIANSSGILTGKKRSGAAWDPTGNLNQTAACRKAVRPPSSL